MKGLIKMTDCYNRKEQRKEWKVIVSTVLKYTGKQVKEPNWSKSVKKIDAYLELVCQENNIDFRHLQGNS